MARMMDIAKKPTPKSDAKDQIDRATESTTKTTEPTVVETPQAEPQRVTVTSEDSKTEAVKPREAITSFALPEEKPETKTLPLGPVLVVLGVIIVLIVAYLLVSVQGA